MTLENVRIAVVLSVAIVAVAFDVRTRRIPNLLTFGAAILALLVATLSGGLSATMTARIQQESVLEQLKQAHTNHEVLADFPELSDEVITQLRITEAELKQEQAALDIRYTPEHPARAAATKKLQMVTADLKNAIESAYEANERKYHALQDNEARLVVAIGMTTRSVTDAAGTLPR